MLVPRLMPPLLKIIAAVYKLLAMMKGYAIFN